MKRTMHIFCFLLAMLCCQFVWSEPSDFRVNDDDGTAEQTHPDMACNNNGRAVICWQDTRDTEPKIYFQLYGRHGYPLLDNRPVYPEGSAQYKPRVAMNHLGHFVIVWQDKQDERSENIYARRFAANGAPLGEVWILNEGLDLQNNYSADIDMSSLGFIIAWIGKDDEDNTKTWYYIKVPLPGFPVRRNLPYNPTASPCVSISDGGIVMSRSIHPFVIAGLEKVDGHYRLWITDSVREWRDVCGYEDQVNDVLDPAVSLASNSDILVCWRYCQNETGFPNHIYSRYYDDSEREFGDIQVISDVENSNNNGPPSIALIKSRHPGLVRMGRTKSKYSITWHSDARNIGGTRADPFDIYSRTLTEGICDSRPLFVNTETIHDQMNPSTDFAQLPNVFQSVWTDNRNGNTDIYARFRADYRPLRFKNQDEYEDKIVLTWDPPFQTRDVTRYKIFRADEREGPYNMIADIDMTGRTILGTQIQSWIDKDVEIEKDYFYYIKNEQSPSFYKGVSDTIRSRIDTEDQHKRKKRSSYASNIPQIDGRINTDEWRHSVLDTMSAPFSATSEKTLLYYQNSDSVLFLAIDDANDSVLDPGNILLLCFDNNRNGAWPRAAGDEGIITIQPGFPPLFVPLWGEYPDNLNTMLPVEEHGVQAAMWEEGGHVQYEIAINSKLSHMDIEADQEIGFAIVLDDPSNDFPYFNGNVFMSGLGLLVENPDTYLSLTFAGEVSDVQEPAKSAVPSEVMLYQNHPNPFNPSTDISFQLTESGFVRLAIYNISGELVKVIADKHFQSGTHHVQWTGITEQGKAAPSGVYVYTLCTQDHKISRKMLLIK